MNLENLGKLSSLWPLTGHLPTAQKITNRHVFATLCHLHIMGRGDRMQPFHEQEKSEAQFGQFQDEIRRRVSL